MDECKEVYEKLLRELSEDQFSISIERSVAQVQLKDGREAQLTLKLETDRREWLLRNDDVI